MLLLLLLLGLLPGERSPPVPEDTGDRKCIPSHLMTTRTVANKLLMCRKGGLGPPLRGLRHLLPPTRPPVETSEHRAGKAGSLRPFQEPGSRHTSPERVLAALGTDHLIQGQSQDR